MTNDRYSKLNADTKELSNSIKDSLDSNNVKATVNCVGSMFQVFFNVDQVNNGTDALKCDRDMFMNMFRRMLDSGVYMPPAALEANFTSTEHGRPEMQMIGEKFEKNLRCII
jgi:glutamate-1-semialdehyde 2,1-aminomutase